jgi:hypothetical protein
MRRNRALAAAGGLLTAGSVAGLAVFAAGQSSAGTGAPVFTAATCAATTTTCDRAHIKAVETFLSGLYPAPSPSSTPPSPPTSPSPPPSSSTPADTTPASTTPPPPPGGFPDASTTGVPAGVALVDAAGKTGTGWHGDAAGNVIITADNAVIDGYLIHGRVDPGSHAAFTLRNSKVECVGENDWCVIMTPGSTVADTEIGGRGCTATEQAQHLTKCYSYAAGIWTGPSGTEPRNLILRVNIHGLTRAVQMDGGTTVQDSYLHDSVFDCAIRSGAPVCGLHSSASFMSKGHGIRFLHDTLQDGSSAVLFGQVYDNDGSTLGDVTIDGNRIRATVEPNGYTSSFGVSIENKHIDVPSSIRITNNVFDAGPWDVGPYRDDGIGYTITGNRTVPAGSPINP